MEKGGEKKKKGRETFLGTEEEGFQFGFSLHAWKWLSPDDVDGRRRVAAVVLGTASAERHLRLIVFHEI